MLLIFNFYFTKSNLKNNDIRYSNTIIGYLKEKLIIAL